MQIRFGAEAVLAYQQDRTQDGLVTVLQTIDRLVGRLAALAAIMGGLMLIALVLMTVLSVTGRALVFAGLRPVPGDFELVEAGTAFAVFAFLPWCQYVRGHASVEVFTNQLPDRIEAVLVAAAEIIFAMVALLITSRLWLGLEDKLQFTETSMILQFPIWWGYAAAFAMACVFVTVAIWCAVRSVLGLIDPALVPLPADDAAR